MTDPGSSSILHTAEIVHWVALGVMAVVYTVRLMWLMRFKPGADRSKPGGYGRTTAQAGAIYSMANVAMPWSMESTRKGFAFYLSFVFFHLGVVAGIGLAFVSSLAPTVVRIPAVAYVVGGLCSLAFVIGVGRIVRRFTKPVMRLISTPDDYFSLFMLTSWFLLGALTQGHLAGVPQLADQNILVAYLFLTSFFLVYVPFSKISHYLYYPFTRYWIGKALGHRGSLPFNRDIKEAP